MFSIETSRLILGLILTVIFLQGCDVCDAETVLVKSGSDYQKAVTITQASLGVVYTNKTDRLVTLSNALKVCACSLYELSSHQRVNKSFHYLFQIAFHQMFNSSADTFINWSFSYGHFHQVVILSNGHFIHCWRSEQFKKQWFYEINDL